jgi:hypothetical protein
MKNLYHVDLDTRHWGKESIRVRADNLSLAGGSATFYREEEVPGCIDEVKLVPMSALAHVLRVYREDYQDG